MSIVKKPIRYLLLLLFLAGIQLLWPTAEVSAADHLVIDTSADIFSDNTGVYAYYFAPERSAYELYSGYDSDYGNVNKAAVRFDLNGIENRTIKKAELKIYVTNYTQNPESAAPFVNVWGSGNDTWIDADADMSAFPSEDTTTGIIANYTFSPADVNSWKSLDVTNYIKSQYADDKIATLVLIGDQSTTPATNRSFIVFYDHIQPGDWGARLEITYVPPPTILGISPNQGPLAGGNSVTISGEDLDGATSVTIDGNVAAITGNTGTALTVTVPAGTAGAKNVVVTTVVGSTTETGLYTYVPAPTVSSISPNQGPLAGGTSVTISGTNLTGATAVTIGGNAATGITVVNDTTITATVPAGTAGAKDVAVTTAGGNGTGTGLYTYVPAPTVSSISPNQGPLAGGTSVTITGTNFTGATAVTIGGNVATGITIVNDTTITAAVPAGTVGAKDVVVTTAGGNGTGTSLYTYLAVPAVTGISPNQGPLAGGTSVTITGTNLTGATAVTIGENAATGITVVNDTTITATVPAGTAGAKDVVVTTAGGNGTGTSLYTYLAVPAVTGISPNQGPLAGGTSVTISGTNLTGATAVTIGGNAATGITIVNDTTITVIVPVGTAGAKDVVVTTAGGNGTGTGLYTYVPAPTVSSISPNQGPLAGGTSVTITGANLTGATAVTIGGNAATGITAVNDTTIKVTVPAGTAGAKDVVVTTAGGSGTGTGLYTYVNAPTVSSISPNEGPLTGGTSVTITGTSLTGATAVTIGGNAATGITVVNDTTITITVPAGTAGAKDVIVTTAGGSITKTGLYTYVNAPTVNSISPNRGPLAGGDSVTITGTNLTGATAVTIGGNAATGITVVNDTTITAAMPAGTAGAKDVVVTTAGGSGTGSSLYTYVTAPSVTTTSPATNITATGAEVAGNVSTDGGEVITERGFAYSTAENPTIADPKKPVTGTTGDMTATLTGLNPSTTYHVRAYATNSVNTSYGSDVSFTTQDKSVTIAASPDLTAANLDASSLNVTLEGDTFIDASLDKANFTLNSALGGLTVETVTHNSATTCTVDLAFDGTDFYDDKNLSLMINGAELNGSANLTSNGLTITAKAKTAPAVGTTTVTNITASAAHLASAVIADGGGGVSVCGFVYGTDPSPILDKVEFGGAIGTIEADLINLRPNTTYYARSYASNSIGTSYSPDASFTTMATGVTVEANPALTRQNLNTARLNVTVEWDAFIDDALDKNNFLLNNAPDGLSVADVVYSTETTCVIDLAYDGTDFTGNRNISLTINGIELTGSDNLTSNELTITNATEPDAPTNVTANAGNKQATVYFTPPLNNGGSAITGYIVTSAPGNITATGSVSPITVTGLNNGTTYTFTVTAVNAIGSSPPSGASPAVTPKASSSSGHGSNSNKSTSATDEISPEKGGKLNLGGEVKLDIPAGALQGTDSVNISITKVSSPQAAPSGFVLLGQVYELSVDDSSSYSFNEPVTITFTFDPKLVPAGFQPAVHYYNINTGEWVNIGGTVSGNKITITIEHFTEFAVMAIKSPGQPEPVPAKFTDISGHWAEAAINQMVDSGMIKGYADGTFRPNQTITRAEFTVVLVKALQLNSGTNRYYKDSAGHWARDYISIAAANGIINGYDEDTFGPDDPITREQMAVMAVKAAKIDKAAAGKKFADDSSISAWARDSIYTAWADKILGGYPDDTIRPLVHTTRAEAVTVISLLLNKK